MAGGALPTTPNFVWFAANDETNMEGPNSKMRQGNFAAEDYNNHYSLLRTIEHALQLLRLTNNDEFA